MSIPIELTAQQRISLENLVAVQTGKTGDLRIYFNLLEKLKTDRKYKRRLIVVLPGGSEIWNEEALAIEPRVTLHLEQEEVDKVKELLDRWERFTTSDLLWVNPLKMCLGNLEISAATTRGKKTAT